MALAGGGDDLKVCVRNMPLQFEKTMATEFNYSAGEEKEDEDPMEEKKQPEEGNVEDIDE